MITFLALVASSLLAASAPSSDAPASDPAAAAIDRYDWHGICAVQLVFQNAQHGGTLASPLLDPLSKAMAQQLLELEVAVPPDLEVESYASRRDRLSRN